MKRPLRVLIVEDNPADAELILRELRRADFEPIWERVDTEVEYLDRLRPDLDIVLSDYSMPRFSSTRALELLQERHVDVPFLIISGTIGEDTAVAAMKRGAADYLLKASLARLGQAVNHALDQRRLRKESQESQKRILRQIDELRRWHDAMLGREDRVQELKREVNELLVLLGRSPRYASQELAEPGSAPDGASLPVR